MSSAHCKLAPTQLHWSLPRKVVLCVVRFCQGTVIVFAASPPSPARTYVPSAPAERLSAVRNISSAKPRGDAVFLPLGLSAALMGSVTLLEASSACFTGVFSVFSARFVCLFPPAETRTPGFRPRHTLNGLAPSTNLASPVDLRTQNDGKQWTRLPQTQGGPGLTLKN